jgi:pyruvate-ferredoxin/flavodoxin oxidoreductase
MQTCFFRITGVLPFETAVAKIKEAIEDTYGKKGGDVLKRNFEAVDRAIAALSTVPPPSSITTDRRRPAAVSPQAPDFVQGVTAVMVANKGDLLPVSAFRWTGRGRSAQASGRRGTSPPRSRYGIPRSASSATSARWSARTRRSA